MISVWGTGGALSAQNCSLSIVRIGPGSPLPLVQPREQQIHEFRKFVRVQSPRVAGYFGCDDLPERSF
jgi:hypothetical protein